MREDARKRILRVAERLLAKHGFAGVSLRDIARAAKVSQPLIHHHFGNKQKLVREVQAKMVERMAPMIPPEGVASENLICTLFQQFFEVFKHDPSLMRMFVWCHLENDMSPWPGEKELMCQILQKVEAAQREGKLPQNVHPMSLLIIAYSTAVAWWQFGDYFATFYEGNSKSASKYEAQYHQDILTLFRKKEMS